MEHHLILNTMKMIKLPTFQVLYITLRLRNLINEKYVISKLYGPENGCYKESDNSGSLICLIWRLLCGKHKRFTTSLYIYNC